MIKLNHNFLLFVFAALLLASCTDDPEPATDIDLISGGSFVTGPKTVTDGNELSAKITARTPTAETRLTRFRILVKYNDIADELIYLDSGLNNTNFNYVFRFNPRQVSGTEKYTFKVTDNNDVVKTTGFLITTNPNNLNADFNSYSIKLWQPTDTLDRSFLSATSAVLFDEIPVKQESFQKMVDMVYFFNDQDSASLTSPADASLDNEDELDLADWTTKNNTEFKKVDEDVFSDANTNQLILNAFPSSPNPIITSLTNLKADNTFAFKTANGKLGILKVSAVTVEDKENSLTLDIKIAK